MFGKPGLSLAQIPQTGLIRSKAKPWQRRSRVFRPTRDEMGYICWNRFIKGSHKNGSHILPGKSFTVRRIASGVGVERTLPISSPSIDSIKVVRRGKVKQSNLYYLRDLTGKKARIKEAR